jgi:hypothetical protein
MRLRGAILCLLLWLATGLRLEAQNFTTVTATNIQDGTGTKLPAGKLCFQATDQNDSPIAFRAGGGGQAINKSVCRDVAAGALTSSFQVANPANTSPLNILYRITVTNGSSEGGALRQGRYPAADRGRDLQLRQLRLQPLDHHTIDALL